MRHAAHMRHAVHMRDSAHMCDAVNMRYAAHMGHAAHMHREHLNPEAHPQPAAVRTPAPAAPQVGDVVRKCSAVFGEDMWQAVDIRRMRWAINNRTSKVKLVLERVRRPLLMEPVWYAKGVSGRVSVDRRDALQLPVSFSSGTPTAANGERPEVNPADLDGYNYHDGLVFGSPGKPMQVGFHRSVSAEAGGGGAAASAAERLLLGTSSASLAAKAVAAAAAAAQSAAAGRAARAARQSRLQSLRSELTAATAAAPLDVSVVAPARRRGRGAQSAAEASAAALAAMASATTAAAPQAPGATDVAWSPPAAPVGNGGGAGVAQRPVLTFLPWLLVTCGRLDHRELMSLATVRGLSALLELSLQMGPVRGEATCCGSDSVDGDGRGADGGEAAGLASHEGHGAAVAATAHVHSGEERALGAADVAGGTEPHYLMMCGTVPCVDDEVNVSNLFNVAGSASSMGEVRGLSSASVSTIRGLSTGPNLGYGAAGAAGGFGTAATSRAGSSGSAAFQSGGGSGGGGAGNAGFGHESVGERGAGAELAAAAASAAAGSPENTGGLPSSTAVAASLLDGNAGGPKASLLAPGTAGTALPIPVTLRRRVPSGRDAEVAALLRAAAALQRLSFRRRWSPRHSMRLDRCAIFLHCDGVPTASKCGDLLAGWLHWFCHMPLQEAILSAELFMGSVVQQSLLEEATRQLIHASEDRMSQVTLMWRNGNVRSVAVAGSIVGGWNVQVPLMRCNNPAGCKGTAGQGHLYVALTGLKPGTYYYKFIVDGTWTVDPASPKVIDASGNYNNVLEVRPRPLPITTRERLQAARWEAARQAFECKMAKPL
eukprot:349929-Chlamydomonas_euryale.AAC.18